MNELLIYGTIGYSGWGEDMVDESTVLTQLAGMNGPIMVRINSGGGAADVGLSLYSALRTYSATKGHVHVVVDAVAASAASLIAMAGDTRTMRTGAWLPIHSPAMSGTMGRGTAADHRLAATQLATLTKAYAAVYAERTGLSVERMIEIMDGETVLDADMALDLRFATARENAPAATAALFDYRQYSHAPAPLLAVAMAIPLPTTETTTSDDNLDPEVEAAAPAEITTPEDETVPAVEPEALLDPAPAEPEPLVTASVLDATAITARERTRVTRIMAAASMAAVPASLTAELIESGATAEVALDRIQASRITHQMSTLPNATPAQILRDERDTRRAAMSEALVAQMTGAAPSDRARAFMTSSLVEMAAICADHRGPMRTIGDKLDVFMAAAHSTSDFPGIFQNALNKTLADRYVGQAPTYREIARLKTFNDFRPHPIVRAGDFPRLQPINENGEIKFGTFGEKSETAVLSSYATGLSISRQMLVNDDLGAINDVLGDAGTMVADFEESTFYALMTAATLASDGLSVFHATYGNLGVASAITVDALRLGKAAMRKQKTIDGLAMNVAPAILLVGPDKEVEALQMVSAITPATAGTVNVFSGSLRVVVSAQLTGNQWFLFADPSRLPNFVYGYLSGAAAPRVRMEEPFGTQGMRVTLEHDFGFGAVDFRGAYRNAGL